MQAIWRTAVRLYIVLAFALAATQLPAHAQNATLPGDLPTAKAYAKFAWAPQGVILGDAPGTLLFADTRGENALRLYARRADTAWGYLPQQTVPSINVVIALPGKQPYEAKGSILLGYDRGGSAFVQTVGDQSHPDHLVAKVDPAGAVKIVAQAPDGLWKPGSGAPSPFSAQALGKTDSPTAGMILGDDRADLSQRQGMSKGKVSWTYNLPSREPDAIRVVLMKADGNVRSPHAELKGFDTDKNAYVQLATDIEEFNGKYYRIDPNGMPSAIDGLPKNLWQPKEPAQETLAPPPAAASAPKQVVVVLPNGKFSVTYTDPGTNQQTSSEMERLAASKNPDTPLDGVYHNEKYMVMIRGTDVRVVPNRVPMGFRVPGGPAN